MSHLFLRILLGLIAVEHFCFMYLEIFLWQKPIGRKIFRTSVETAAISAKLAMNQGLYNAFLAAGIVWALVAQRNDVAIFFCACVSLAGLFGALTVNKRIFFVQALPAIVALLFLCRE